MQLALLDLVPLMSYGRVVGSREHQDTAVKVALMKNQEKSFQDSEEILVTGMTGKSLIILVNSARSGIMRCWIQLQKS